MLEILPDTPKGTASCTLRCTSNIPQLLAEATEQNIQLLTVILKDGILFNVPGLEFLKPSKGGNIYLYNQRRYRIKLVAG